MVHPSHGELVERFWVTYLVWARAHVRMGIVLLSLWGLVVLWRYMYGETVVWGLVFRFILSGLVSFVHEGVILAQ